MLAHNLRMPAHARSFNLTRKATSLSLILVAVVLANGAPFAVEGPQTSQNHLQRAVDLVSRGNLVEAEKEAQKVLANPATAAPAYSVLGTIRLQQQRLEESRQLLEKAVRLNPNLLGARLTLAQVYTRQGKAEQARETLITALKLAPGNPVALMNLGQLEASAGNFQKSLESVQPIREDLRRIPDGLLLLLVDTLGLGYKETAQGLVRDWLELQPAAPPLLAIEFAKPLLEHQLNSEAVQVLERARGNDDPIFELAFALGGAYLAQGDTAKASGYYERAESLNPKCVLCFQQIARIARKDGEKEKALAYLIKAKMQAPENAEVLFEFGRQCVEGNLYRDAIPALEKAVQLDPQNDRYGYVLSTAYVGKQRYKESLAILDRLLQKHPEDPVLPYAYGSVLYTEGLRLELAEEYLKKSIQLQPDQIGAYYYLGMVTVKKGDQEQAAVIFRELLARHPEHQASLEELGTILVKLRRNDEAREVLETVLQRDPRSLAGHYQYGLLLGRLGQGEESKKHMDIAKQLEEERKVESKREFYLLDPNQIGTPMTPVK